MLQHFPQANVLRVTDGPTKSAVWMQMLADLTGRRLEVPAVEETGCLGAAWMAMQAAGLTEEPQALRTEMQVFTPNAQHFAAYNKKYQRYQQFVNALKTLL